MEHSEELAPRAVRLRLNPEQPLWLLRAAEGTYLVADLTPEPDWLLAWTTRGEMDASVRRLGGHAPVLFRDHQPVQRSFEEAMETAYQLGCRLSIDEYVVEGFALPTE